MRVVFGIDYFVEFEETGQIDRDPQVIRCDCHFLIFFKIEVYGKILKTSPNGLSSGGMYYEVGSPRHCNWVFYSE
jgi:hypothetical protein